MKKRVGVNPDIYAIFYWEAFFIYLNYVSELSKILNDFLIAPYFMNILI